jgi:DNA-binding winged helix-turn-helix (wHTH) protein/TolB-like protein/Tfp pilus assembly protein PilF
MGITNGNIRCYEFSHFHLDTHKRRLSHQGEAILLPHKAMDTLLVLLERHGKIVERDELLRAVWGEAMIEDANLTVAISTLRKTLGQHAGEPLIETVPRVGYRFMAEVRETFAPESLPATPQSTGDARQLPSVPTALSAAVPAPWGLLRGITWCLVLLSLLITAWWAWRKERPPISPAPSSAVPPATVKSIAVLPFKMLAPQPKDKYLILGIANTLIHRFSRWSEIKVRPLSAVQGYQDSSLESLAIGQQQQVDAVLEGAIQRAGKQLRITVRLIQMRDGASLWSDQYDLEGKNILATQDSLAEAVAPALARHFKTEERAQAATRSTSNAEAYQLYLKGEYLRAKQNPAELSKAMNHFQQAVTHDPLFTLAYVKLAYCHLMQGYLNMQPPKEAFQRVQYLAQKAIKIDATSSEAYLLLSFVTMDQIQAEKYWKQALELEPNNLEIRVGAAYHHLTQGKFAEAQMELKKALESDPLSFRTNHMMGLTYYFNRQYDQAIAHCRRLLELEPGYALARITIADAYVQQGKYDDAIAEYKQADGVIEDETNDDQIAAALALSGRRVEAIRILNHLKAQARRSYISPFNLARICISLGERGEALSYLQKAYEDQVGEFRFLKVDPRFESLHHDQRFMALLRQMNLTL